MLSLPLLLLLACEDPAPPSPDAAPPTVTADRLDGVLREAGWSPRVDGPLLTVQVGDEEVRLVSEGEAGVRLASTPLAELADVTSEAGVALLLTRVALQPDDPAAGFLRLDGVTGVVRLERVLTPHAAAHGPTLDRALRSLAASTGPARARLAEAMAGASY